MEEAGLFEIWLGDGPGDAATTALQETGSLGALGMVSPWREREERQAGFLTLGKKRQSPF
jgi:hypothetical protein